jgi:hypothetical protein
MKLHAHAFHLRIQLLFFHPATMGALRLGQLDDAVGSPRAGGFVPLKNLRRRYWSRETLYSDRGISGLLT